jgi:hypothetical protein
MYYCWFIARRRQVKPSVGDECCVLYSSSLLHLYVKLRSCLIIVRIRIYICVCYKVFLFLARMYRVCILTSSPQEFPYRTELPK